MEIESALITGGSRGIGLEIAKQLSELKKPPQVIFVTYRDEKKLKELEEVQKQTKETEFIFIKADVTDSNDIKAAYKVVEEKMKDKGLTLLVNNAGVCKKEAFEEMTEENLLFHYKTNTMAPILFFKEMLPLLEKAAARKKEAGMSVSRAAVINITSKYASLGNADVGEEWIPYVGYRISKTAMNMAMRSISILVKDKGILVVCVHPGWLKTDMGKSYAPEEVSDGIRKLFETIAKLDDSYHGALIERDGKPIAF